MKKSNIVLAVLSCSSYLCLNGCMNMLYTCQQKEALRQECLQSYVLITDLTNKYPDQQFQLPNGKTCQKDWV